MLFQEDDAAEDSLGVIEQVNKDDYKFPEPIVRSGYKYILDKAGHQKICTEPQNINKYNVYKEQPDFRQSDRFYKGDFPEFLNKIVDKSCKMSDYKYVDENDESGPFIREPNDLSLSDKYFAIDFDKQCNVFNFPDDERLQRSNNVLKSEEYIRNLLSQEEFPQHEILEDPYNDEHELVQLTKWSNRYLDIPNYINLRRDLAKDAHKDEVNSIPPPDKLELAHIRREDKKYNRKKESSVSRNALQNQYIGVDNFPPVEEQFKDKYTRTFNSRSNSKDGVFSGAHSTDQGNTYEEDFLSKSEDEL